MTKKIEIYDTTLRDGSQGLGIDFSLEDKLLITQSLDDIGVSYIEGGYPLSNPKDKAYFEAAKTLNLNHAKIVAFGMTRRKGIKPQEDIGLKALIEVKTPVVTIVGKTWDLHAQEILKVSLNENLEMIKESVSFCNSYDHIEEVIYDAEHFFDGYKSNPNYALKTIQAAFDGGASRVVLCDTNGGSLPSWIAQVISEVRAQLGDVNLGIHPHNDCNLANANVLEAISHGVDHVQGTINGIGERCGNVDLISVIANLELKLNFQCLHPSGKGIKNLTKISRLVYEVSNTDMIQNQPYVSKGAFTHKGGMHVHAVNKLASSYEHIDPKIIGNQRQVVISELSGISNLQALLGDKFKDLNENRELQKQLLIKLQDLEYQGYQFEGALASFELITYKLLNETLPSLWDLDFYHLRSLSQSSLVEAVIKMSVKDQEQYHVAQGHGPVNALENGIRKCLENKYISIKDLKLIDYKVRVVNSTQNTAAKVRVIGSFTAVDSTGKRVDFSTIGVNENIIEASWKVLSDAFEYYLHLVH